MLIVRPQLIFLIEIKVFWYSNKLQNIFFIQFKSNYILNEASKINLNVYTAENITLSFVKRLLNIFNALLNHCSIFLIICVDTCISTENLNLEISKNKQIILFSL